jgi:hypothetical protein
LREAEERQPLHNIDLGGASIARDAEVVRQPDELALGEMAPQCVAGALAAPTKRRADERLVLGRRSRVNAGGVVRRIDAQRRRGRDDG